MGLVDDAEDWPVTLPSSSEMKGALVRCNHALHSRVSQRIFVTFFRLRQKYNMCKWEKLDLLCLPQ